jgi:hypothetical protein
MPFLPMDLATAVSDHEELLSPLAKQPSRFQARVLLVSIALAQTNPVSFRAPHALTQDSGL